MRRLISLFALLLLALPALADKWALVVGIDDYKDRNHISSLTGAARDARQYRKTLIEVMGVAENHIQLLVADKTREDDESLPTRSHILLALSRLKQSAKAGDTVFVYFSGHGIRVGTKDYLLPYDFEGIDAETGIDTALAEDLFYERLSQVQAGAIVLVWDKCRNDPFAKTRAGGPQRNTLSSSQASKGWNVVRGEGTPALPSLIKLFACSPGQCSYEWTDKGQGYFTYFLERGLRGAAADSKGKITVKSLKDYLLKEVAARVKQNENAQQVPHATLDGTSPEDIVLAVAGKAVAAAPDPVRPPTGGKPTPKTTPPGDLQERPEPVKSGRLAERVLEAHQFSALASLGPVKLTGSGRITSPDPENLAGLSVTFTPEGRFRSRWNSTDGLVDIRGDASPSIQLSVNNVAAPLADPQLKQVAIPHAILWVALQGLQKSPSDWKEEREGTFPVLTATETDGGASITLRLTIDPQTSRIQKIVVKAGALGVTTNTITLTITRYEALQGVPLPATLSLESISPDETLRMTHTYTKRDAHASL